MKKLAAILLLFLSTVSAQGADNQRDLTNQETFKILGVELGKDTIDDLEKVTKEKNCRTGKRSGCYALSKECFDLPGDYTIGYYFDPVTKKISSIDFMLEINNVDGLAAMDKYLDALKAKYGKPSYHNYITDLWTWEWDFPNLNIYVTRSALIFRIRYTSQIVTKMVKEREVNKISGQI